MGYSLSLVSCSIAVLFYLTVPALALNTPPTITDIPDQIGPINLPIGPLPFTIGDAEDDPNLLIVFASSSNTTLIHNSDIFLGGSGVNRTIELLPSLNETGETFISLFVLDSQLGKSSSDFKVTIGSSVASVPDGGGSALLLGCSVLGLAFLQPCFIKRK